VMVFPSRVLFQHCGHSPGTPKILGGRARWAPPARNVRRDPVAERRLDLAKVSVFNFPMHQIGYIVSPRPGCDGRHSPRKKGVPKAALCFAQRRGSAERRDRRRRASYAVAENNRSPLRRLNPSAASPVAIKAQVAGSGTGVVFDVTFAVNSPISTTPN
jgi:hypothetical protein